MHTAKYINYNNKRQKQGECIQIAWSQTIHRFFSLSIYLKESISFLRQNNLSKRFLKLLLNYATDQAV